MADLSDERLAVLIARAMAPPNTSQEIYAGELNQIVAELQRRRTEQAAGREHVERVVREIAYHEAAGHDCIGGSTLNRASDAIARRVADRLSAPVLSTEEVALLEWSKKEHEVYVESAKYQKRSQTGVANARQAIALLERLIGGTRP